MFIQADDAAACLSYLAGLGSQGVNCGLTEFQYDLQMWKVGNAQVVGSKSTGPSVSTNWYVEEVHSIYHLILSNADVPCE